jgi:cytochrome P450
MPRIPPGPRGHFLIGNLWQLFQEPFAFTLRCARAYGDVVRLRLGTLVIYMINHPEAIEEVLRSKHRLFQKDRGTHLLSSVLGQGLVTSEADLWRRQRRFTQPAFQLDQIQKYSTVMAACAGRALEGWRPGQTRDVHADMMRLTLEIVARSLFGAGVTDHADRVGRAMDTVTEFFASPLAMFPWLHWLPLSIFRRYRRAVRELDAVLYATIGRRRTATEAGDGLLTRLLAARDEDGNPMTDRQLRDELVTLFLAGHETTPGPDVLFLPAGATPGGGREAGR